MHLNDEFACEEMRDERRITEQPWLAKQLAGRVEAPGRLEERVELLIRLSRLPLRKQTVTIGGCAHRDALVEHLLGRGEFGAILNLLHKC